MNTPVVGNPERDIFATLSLVFGALSIFLACCIAWIPFIGLLACCFTYPMGAGGLVLGYLGLPSTQKQNAQIGIGLSGAAIVLYTLVLILGFVTGFAGAIADG